MVRRTVLPDFFNADTDLNLMIIPLPSLRLPAFAEDPDELIAAHSQHLGGTK